MSGTGLGFVARTGTPEAVVRAAGREAEAAGLAGLWANNPPGGDGLTPNRWAAEETSWIGLGTGVVPVSAHPAAEIASRLTELDLPRDRYRLGLGSGSGPHPRRRVAEALDVLRTSGYELVVGALGPGMCRLAGEAGDAILLSGVDPRVARESGGLAREAAEAAGRRPPRVYAGVLFALGPGAADRLRDATAFVAGLPQYVAHYERTGLRPEDTVVPAEDAAELADRLARWRGVVDELVLTPIVEPEGLTGLLETAAGAWAASA